MEIKNKNMNSILGKKKVVVFDDDQDTLMICSIILQGRGYEVHTFNNASDVLEQVRALQPDVILMDNWIPDKGGQFATRSLKNDEELKHIPVIYFSANNDVQRLAAEAGADMFIAKPFDVVNLEKIVDAACGERAATV
jgi:two-component system cell cycle response regulator DivK